MIPNPLHPAVVHFPIVLAFVLPVAAIAALLLLRRGRPARGTWVWVVVTAAALTASSWVALRTGQREEDRAERVVPENAIHEHEEAAEAFMLASAIVLLLAAAGLAPGRLGTATRWVTTAGTLVVLGLGYNVGDKGGRLVYQHGAAQAYVQGGAGTAAPGGLDQDDDDERREGRRPSEEDDER